MRWFYGESINSTSPLYSTIFFALLNSLSSCLKALRLTDQENAAQYVRRLLTILEGIPKLESRYQRSFQNLISEVSAITGRLLGAKRFSGPLPLSLHVLISCSVGLRHDFQAL
jgi:hypothetical protein